MFRRRALAIGTLRCTAPAQTTQLTARHFCCAHRHTPQFYTTPVSAARLASLPLAQATKPCSRLLSSISREICQWQRYVACAALINECVQVSVHVATNAMSIVYIIANALSVVAGTTLVSLCARSAALRVGLHYLYIDTRCYADFLLISCFGEP